MTRLYNALLRPILFNLDAERAHTFSIHGLKTGLHLSTNPRTDKRLEVNLAGLNFPNPLGMAAGYDKNAEVPDALLKLGFGHAEIGTVTPKPQPGNPKPRIFRLPKDRAVINRLGFNSGGHDLARRNLIGRKTQTGIVGINIGANKSSEDFAADYVTGIHAFYDLASYFTVNISSPNTPGLRALQGADPLNDLMQRVSDARQDKIHSTGNRVPIFLKIAPDLEETEIDSIASIVSGSDFDGLIVSNTTLARSGLVDAKRSEQGGLSGKPLFERATIVLAKMRQRLNTEIPLIGVGGVHDGSTAISKIEAGAHLIQLYTGLIYQGPGLPASILSGLSNTLNQEGLSNLDQLRGRKTDDWASKSLPPA